ncbi:MAG: DUF6932 family protein [Saprospiraceae bacterium]
MNFDEHGNLTPSQPIESDLREVEDVLVFNEHRRRLFEELLSFVDQLLALDLSGFHIWLNGSFTTLKPKPRDIDAVIFISYREHAAKCQILSELKKKFSGLIDAYFVPVCPESHPDFRLYNSDRIDWLFLFSSDRDRRKKGFLEIKFIQKNGKADN